MDRNELIALAERYFAAIDAQDFAAVTATLCPDCVFTVETHGVRIIGLAGIAAMCERLWKNQAAVEHRDFVYVADPEQGRLAVQFTVINTLRDGSRDTKSNGNFFAVRDGVFSRVAVYMAGENTLEVP